MRGGVEMNKMRGMKLNFRRLMTFVALGALVLPTQPWAQQLTHQQMVTSLNRVQKAGGAIDVALLQQQVSENVGKGVSNLPNWASLGKLLQIIVAFSARPGCRIFSIRARRTYLLNISLDRSLLNISSCNSNGERYAIAYGAAIQR